MKTQAAFLALSLLLSGAVMVPAHAQIFGESDKEKAARQAHEDDQNFQIAQQGTRIQQLEDKARSLTESLSSATGANEQLAHQIAELRQQIADQQKDFSYRLCMISAQQLGAGADDQGLNCGATGATASNAPANGPAGIRPGQALPPIGSDQGFSSAPPQQLSRPPGTLGSLPMGSGPMGSGPQTALAVPRGGASQYDRAMNLLAKAQYIEAAAAFRAYADANPDDNDLSAQAIYWIGDIAYVQHDYPTATRSFAEQIKKYPDSPRSPDSMLKLGQSLVAQGQISGGCTALDQIKVKYPKAPDATLAAAAGASKAAACTKARR